MAAGVFEWKRRMGVHEAYHQDARNRLVHWLCIPVELLSVVALLALIPLGPARDAALVALVCVAPIYLATEPLLGTLMIAFLAGCRFLAVEAGAWSALATLALAVVLFTVTFTVQLRLGHAVFEGGRDDTDKNLAELRRTKNPIPILLVFYYHLVELAFAVGYRPRLRDNVAAFTRAELTAFERAPGSSSAR
jgi:uncharacterized membrane protein YGL010W